MPLTVFEKIIKNYTLSFITIWLGAMLLARPDTHWFATFYGISFMHAWVYFIHRGLHIIPKAGILEYINTHMKFHHNHVKELPRPLELCFEALTDVGMNLLIIPVQWLLGLTIVPLSCVLLFTLAYVSIHIVNYSMFGSIFHIRHHETIEKNFAPDIMDHLVGTNFNEEYEDLNPMALNVVICVFFLMFFKQVI